MKFRVFALIAPFVFVLCGSAVAQANWTLAQTVIEKENQIQIVNTLTCDAKKTDICVSLCQASACEWVEPSCRDCLGSTSEVLRDVFTRLPSTYRIETNGRLLPSASMDLIVALQSMPIILLGDRSPYDFFNSSQDSEFSKNIETACGSKNGFVAVSLDDESRPLTAVFAICPSRIVRLLK